MSAHEPPQFTPAQVLDAGRRAEAEARVEFAVQLYTHLAQHYPGTAEAGAALQGLARLSPMTAPQPAKGGWEAAPNQGAAGIEPRLEASSAPQPRLVSPFDRPPAPEPAFTQPAFQQPAFAPPPVDQPSFTQWPQEAPEPPLPAAFSRDAEGRGVELPPPHRDYRSGRALARLAVWLGVAQVLTGLAILAVAFLSPRTIAGLPVLKALVSGPLTGVWLAAAGLAQIVLGQLVRALLDQANATRDIAAAMRARAGGAEPARPRGRRR